jgi:anti-sigma regulatory factor (Ser/Thr protein kinase)
VTDLNAYARGTDRAVEVFSLAETIDLALRMTRAQLEQVTHVERDYGDLSPFVGYPGRLSQVFVNLFVNAAQAMRERERERNVLRVAARRDGDHVVVTVADNGPGMSAEIAARVFEPFFTTKDEGLRSGLGLWVSRGVVEEHRGALTVDSRPGQGTTFTLRMRGLDRPSPASPSRAPREPRRRATLLFVDDEPLLLSAFVRALGADHDVLGAASVPEALALIETRGGDVDVIVCDLLLPVVSGVRRAVGALPRARAARRVHVGRRLHRSHARVPRPRPEPEDRQAGRARGARARHRRGHRRAPLTRGPRAGLLARGGGVG